MHTCIYSTTINHTCTIMRQKLRQIKRSKRDPTISRSCSSLVIMFIKDITYTTRSPLYFDVYIPQLLFQCNNTSLLINYCYIYINKMRTVFVIQIVQLVMRTSIQYTYIVGKYKIYLYEL